MTILFFVVFVTLAISAICSLMESTLYSTRIASLEAAKSHNKHVDSANSMLAMKKDIARPTSAILILNTIANTAGATVAGMLAAQEFGSIGVPIFSAVLTIAILLLSEILPKTLGAVHWRFIWPFVVPPLRVIEKVLAPFIWMTQWFSGIFVRGKSAPVTTEAEILSLIRLGAGVGELTQTELELLTNVFRFDEITAKQVMIPRRQVVGFESDCNYDQCMKTISQSGHTRYPVYNESLDNIVGILNVKDLLNARDPDNFDIKNLTREILHVPDNTRLRSLLRQMQSMRRHMAAVVDERGTFVGIITLENVIEQITGSIQDEFDNESPDIEQTADGSYLVKGSTPIFAFANRLKIKLSQPADVDTVSGLVAFELGRVPEKSDEVSLGVATAKVVEVQDQCAVLLAVTTPEKNKNDDEEDF